MPSNLAPITLFLNPDEKAFGLDETVMTPFAARQRGYPSDSWAGRHRYQIIGVNRDGKLTLHCRDMGLSENFNYGGIRIAALWEHSVAEVQDMAEQIREGGAWERGIIAERQGQKPWGERLDEQYDTARQNLANRSIFGHYLTVERNGRSWKGAASVR